MGTEFYFSLPSHAIRSIVGAPLLAIFSAYGFTQLIDWLRFKTRVLFLATFPIVALSLAIFCQQYFSEYPLKVTEEWQHGIREAITYAEKSSYDCVIITDNDYHCLNLYNFSAFIPFYTQYPPAKYQLSPTLPWSQDREQNINFDKYSMKAISRQSELNKRCLFIIRPEEVKSIVAKGYNYKEVHLVKDSRGVEYFKLIEISLSRRSPRPYSIESVVERGLKTKFIGCISHPRYDEAPSTDECE